MHAIFNLLFCFIMVIAIAVILFSAHVCVKAKSGYISEG
jgi:hypothetical protein